MVTRTRLNMTLYVQCLPCSSTVLSVSFIMSFVYISRVRLSRYLLRHTNSICLFLYPSSYLQFTDFQSKSYYSIFVFHITGKYINFLSLCAFFKQQYESVVLLISLFHINALGFNYRVQFSCSTLYFMQFVY